MFADQVAIEDKAAGAEDDPAPRPDQYRLPMISLQLADFLSQAIAIPRSEVLPALGAGRQTRMLTGFTGARRQTPKLGTDHAPGVIDHQAPRRRLQQRLHSGAQAGVFQMAIQHSTALPLAHRAMTAWRRRLLATMGRHQFVAGVIQKIAIGGIRSFAPRRHAVGIACAVAFEPAQVVGTVIAEFAQGVVADHATGFVLEVVKHRLRGVAEAGVLLLSGTAARIHHAATLGAGAAAGKTVGDNHLGPLATGLQCGAGAGSPPTDHQYVAALVPVPIRQTVQVQRGQDFSVAGGPGPLHDTASGAVLAATGTLLAIWLAAI